MCALSEDFLAFYAHLNHAVIDQSKPNKVNLYFTLLCA